MFYLRILLVSTILYLTPILQAASPLPNTNDSLAAGISGDSINLGFSLLSDDPNDSLASLITMPTVPPTDHSGNIIQASLLPQPVHSPTSSSSSMAISPTLIPSADVAHTDSSSSSSSCNSNNLPTLTPVITHPFSALQPNTLNTIIAIILTQSEQLNPLVQTANSIIDKAINNPSLTQSDLLYLKNVTQLLVDRHTIINNAHQTLNHLSYVCTMYPITTYCPTTPVANQNNQPNTSLPLLATNQPEVPLPSSSSTSPLNSCPTTASLERQQNIVSGSSSSSSSSSSHIKKKRRTE